MGRRNGNLMKMINRETKWGKVGMKKKSAESPNSIRMGAHSQMTMGELVAKKPWQRREARSERPENPLTKWHKNYLPEKDAMGGTGGLTGPLVSMVGSRKRDRPGLPESSTLVRSAPTLRDAGGGYNWNSEEGGFQPYPNLAKMATELKQANEAENESSKQTLRGQLEAGGGYLPPLPSIGLAEREGLSRSHRKELLRKQFVAQAKKHLGEPYTQTDCCGLVRECVHELPGFGFRLSKCDQGVMYDTLMNHSIPKK